MAAGKLILVYQPNTSDRHPHRLVYEPDTGTILADSKLGRDPPRRAYQPNTGTKQILSLEKQTALRVEPGTFQFKARNVSGHLS